MSSMRLGISPFSRRVVPQDAAGSISRCGGLAFRAKRFGSRASWLDRPDDARHRRVARVQTASRLAG